MWLIISSIRNVSSLAYNSGKERNNALDNESRHRDQERGNGTVHGALRMVDAEAAVPCPRHFGSSVFLQVTTDDDGVLLGGGFPTFTTWENSTRVVSITCNHKDIRRARCALHV